MTNSLLFYDQIFFFSDGCIPRLSRVKIRKYDSLPTLAVKDTWALKLLIQIRVERSRFIVTVKHKYMLIHSSLLHKRAQIFNTE